MRPPVKLQTFLGNARAVEILTRAIKQDRLPHAMIFSGPAGVGKCTLALLVAQYLNCQAPLPNGPCDSCSICKRILAVIESRYLECESPKEAGFCGSCPACRIRTKRHPDVRLVEPDGNNIRIKQVQDLIGEIAFQPLEARYRVVVLDPAEQMSLPAHHSLLKTLEEPPSRTVIILVTTNPYMLLETIRSRARMLQFGEIPQNQIEQHLVAHEGRTAEEARLAAVLSGGSMAAALEFNTEEYLNIRKHALQFITLTLRGGKFSEASALAGQVAKDKQAFRVWIESVTALLRDVYYATVAAERVGQRDLLDTIQDLGRTVSHAALLRTIEGIRKLKGQLSYNVNRQIALEALFVDLTRNPG
jgi:DNA polymerase-3 subunit delta'